jgi:hypothetical protein
MSATRWFTVAFLALAVGGGVGVLLQRQSAAALRAELMLLRDENRELAGLRSENQRLISSQVAPAEWARLQADHAAVARLRDEIKTLSLRAEQMEQSQENTRDTSDAVQTPTPPPALALKLEVGADGRLSLDRAPLDLSFVRQRLSGLMKGDRVEIRLQMPPQAKLAQSDDLQQSTRQLMGFAKELGLKMEIRIDRTNQ